MRPSDLEEFVPEDELDAGFLEDEGSSKIPTKAIKKNKSHASVKASESSSEESDESDRYCLLNVFGRYSNI